MKIITEEVYCRIGAGYRFLKANVIAMKYGVAPSTIYRLFGGSRPREIVSDIRAEARRIANERMFGKKRMLEIDYIYKVLDSMEMRECVVFDCKTENLFSRFRGLLYRWNKKHQGECFMSGEYDSSNYQVSVTKLREKYADYA